MKKLMIAAAVAAMTTGAFSGTFCEDDILATEEYCQVYDFKMTLTTLQPKKTKIKSGDACSESSCSLCYYFEKGKRTFNGIFWDCFEACSDDAPATNFVAWEKKSKKAITAPLSVGHAANYDYFQADSLSFEILSRFGKKATKVQAYAPISFSGDDFEMEGAIAGMGSFDTKKELLKSISGSAAVKLTPAEFITKGGKCTDDVGNPGMVVGLCDCFDGDWCSEGIEADNGVAGYGSWSVKYNKSYSKGKKKIVNVVPAYAQER